MTEPRLYTQTQMTAVEAYPLAGGRVAVFSTRSPARTAPNEDAAAVLAIDDQSAVLVVADGLGGGPNGEHASALAVAALRDALHGVSNSGDAVRTAILSGIETANAKIQQAAPDSATTLAVV